jgi:hypothetical protein
MGEVLIGKAAGDMFEMPDRLVQPQTATVREIQSKYERGFQDSIENFAKLFPGASILQPFDVGDGDKPDLTFMVESLKGCREHVEKCLQLYRDQPVPLFLLSACVGVSELEAVKGLSQHPGGIVRCSDASPESFALAVHAGIASGATVLSMPALITLTLVALDLLILLALTLSMTFIGARSLVIACWLVPAVPSASLGALFIAVAHNSW